MFRKYHLSDAERVIMEKLWSLGEPVRQPELWNKLAEDGHAWNRQPFNTMLARLEEQGILRRENHLVTAVYTKKEFGLLIMKEAVAQFYEGDVADACASFAKSQRLTKEQKERLEELLK